MQKGICALLLMQGSTTDTLQKNPHVPVLQHSSSAVEEIRFHILEIIDILIILDVKLLISLVQLNVHGFYVSQKLNTEQNL